MDLFSDAGPYATILLLALLIVVVIVAVLLYRSRSSTDQLHVEPHARKEIEKAKRR